MPTRSHTYWCNRSPSIFTLQGDRRCCFPPTFPVHDFEALIEKFSTPALKSITMMYVDLKGFTAFCGSVLGNKADQIINTLNCFFSSAVPCVLEYGGTIDKFQGDGFIALFNAYQDCPIMP